MMTAQPTLFDIPRCNRSFRNARARYIRKVRATLRIEESERDAARPPNLRAKDKKIITDDPHIPAMTVKEVLHILELPYGKLSGVIKTGKLVHGRAFSTAPGRFGIPVVRSDGAIFRDAVTAAEVHGRTNSAIRMAMTCNQTCAGYGWRYANRDEVELGKRQIARTLIRGGTAA